jgi:hypothetical protein
MEEVVEVEEDLPLLESYSEESYLNSDEVEEE